MEAFSAWAGGELEREADVREVEHEADTARRTMVESLRTAFTSPLPSENLFEISQSLDRIINSATNVVREASLMGVVPDRATHGMAALLEEGLSEFDGAFAPLCEDVVEATGAADSAIKTQRRLERVYRTAVSELLEVRDLREVLSKQELYRRPIAMSESVVTVAESVVTVARRIWHCSVK
jgi:uncharacterized protein Yka (UPF0111/DUF47 family)